MKLFIIECWNKVGGCIGKYYVAAPNITTAKNILKTQLDWSVGKMVLVETERLYH